jgi:hypothetical protein
MDCLILIPIDDAFIKMTTQRFTVTTARELQAYQYPDGVMSGYVQNGGIIFNPVIFNDARNWCMPLGASSARIVCAAQVAFVNEDDDYLDIGWQYVRRWRTLRGSDA